MNFQPLAAVFIFVVPIVLITLLIKAIGKRADFYEHILLSSGSVLLSILIYLTLHSWIYGQSAFDAVWNSFRKAFTNGFINANQLLSMYHQWGIFQNFTTADQLADFLIGQMKMVVPSAILLYSLIYGVVLFLIIRSIMYRLGYQTPEVRPFEDWALPRRMTFGLIILLLVSFLGHSLGIARFEVVQITVASLISFLFMVLGLSVMWFFLKAGRVPSVLRWLLIIFIYLIAGFALPFLGIFDQLFHIRWNYRNKFLFRNGR